MSPQNPIKSEFPPQDTVENLANGGIHITTKRGADFPGYLEWVLGSSQFPAGANVTWVETRVCGSGTGDFFEVYGPYDSDPVEYEVTARAADGCWHFAGTAGDFTVTIYVYDNSTMTINDIEMKITFDR